MVTFMFNRSKAFTLVELILVVALFGIVTSAIYSYFTFGYIRSIASFDETNLLMDARDFQFNLDSEIRQANRPVLLSDLPLAPTDVNFPSVLKSSKAAIVEDSGKRLTLYTYHNSLPKRITYRVVTVGGQLNLEKSIVDPHVLYDDIVDWTTQIKDVQQNRTDAFFSIDASKSRSKVIVSFLIREEKKSISRPIEIYTVYTIRGREAMQ